MLLFDSFELFVHVSLCKHSFEQCVRSFAFDWLSQIRAAYQSDYISSYIFIWNGYHKIQHTTKIKRMNYNCWYSFLHLHIRIAYNVLLKALMFEPGKPKYNICSIDSK